jgi:hypothetical protein
MLYLKYPLKTKAGIPWHACLLLVYYGYYLLTFLTLLAPPLLNFLITALPL